jgi:predicted hydrocarbon binding protein
VICAVDRGMVQGLLGSLYGETEVALTASMARGDDACVTDVQST